MPKRTGLGRGLDSLLPAPTARPEGEGRLLDLPVAWIEANPEQPRRRFEEESMSELAASVAAVGVLQPLLARRVGPDRYRLIAGERRLRAARQVGLQTVPVLIVETDERGSLERALVENIQRADLNAIEEASAYRALIDDGGLTHEELATRLGRSRAAITNALRLLELSPDIQREIINGRLTGGHGRALLPLQASPFQKRLAQRVAQEGLSVRETEELVRRYAEMTGGVRSSQGTGRTRAAPEVVEAQRALADKLQTRVRIESGKRKGRIVIDFVSDEELDRIVDVILERERGGVTRTIVLDPPA